MFDIEPELGSLFDDVILQLDVDETPELSRAGMDELTPVDKVIGANGDYIFVTEV